MFIFHLLFYTLDTFGRMQLETLEVSHVMFPRNVPVLVSTAVRDYGIPKRLLGLHGKSDARPSLNCLFTARLREIGVVICNEYQPQGAMHSARFCTDICSI